MTAEDVVALEAFEKLGHKLHGRVSHDSDYEDSAPCGCGSLPIVWLRCGICNWVFGYDPIHYDGIFGPPFAADGGPVSNQPCGGPRALPTYSDSL